MYNLKNNILYKEIKKQIITIITISRYICFMMQNLILKQIEI